MAGSISVKVAYADDIRMLSVDLEKVSHTRFVALVAEKYNINYDKEKKEVEVFHATYAFKYTDSEGDVVTISDKSDFNAWLEMAKVYGKLRLSLVNKCKDKAEKMKAEKKSPNEDQGGPSTNWWDKKAKYEKKLRKLKMLPTKVKAGLIVEVISDDPALAPYVHDTCHHLKGKGKGKGEKGKGKGEKGKGKGEKGKGKGHGIWNPYEEYPGYGYGPDHDSWVSAYWGYHENGGHDWSPSRWDEWHNLPSEHQHFPEESVHTFGRGHGEEGLKMDIPDKGCGKKTIMARFVSDVTVPPQTQVDPGEQFTKTWRVRNDSKDSWPSDVYLICVGGDPMNEPLHPTGEPTWHKWNGDGCAPGEEVDVSVILTAPSQTGSYEAYWRLCYSSPEHGFKKFGMRLPLWTLVGCAQAELKLPVGVTTAESEVVTEQATHPAESSGQSSLFALLTAGILGGEPTGGPKGKGAFKGKGALKGKGFKGKGKGLEDWSDHWSSQEEQYGHDTAYGRGWGKAGKGSGKKILLARFVRDVNITPGETLLGGIQFTKTWRVRNDSGQPWPANSLILFVGGDSDFFKSPEPGRSQILSQKPILSQDTCLPGEELDVSIDLQAPTLGGTYEAFWRLCANFPDRGFKKFGMRLRVKVNVCDGTPQDSAPTEVKSIEPESALEVDPLGGGGVLTDDSETENNGFVHVDA